MNADAIRVNTQAGHDRGWPRRVASRGLLPIVLVLICVFFAYSQPLFIAPRNISNILTQSSYLVMLAAAQMIVLIVRGFDLSMGTLLSAVSVAVGLLMSRIVQSDPNAIGMSIAVAIIVAIGFGIVAGLINGACVVFLKVNPFVVTLGTQGVAASFAATASGGFPVFGLPVQFTDIFSRANLFGVPVSVVAAIAMLIVVHFVLNRTTFGRGIYLYGSNPRAAEVAGLPTRRYVLGAYVLCSLFIAVVAVLLTSRTGSGEPNIGGGLMLQSIAAAVIGGVSLRGGQGSIWHCVLGGIFLTVLSNGMDLLQVDSFLQMIILGVIFIAAVFVDRLYSASART